MVKLLALRPTKEDARWWLHRELAKVFPKVEALVQNMQVTVLYKDITFETLNHEDFLRSVKDAYPSIDWVRAYEEYRAAGEKM